MLTPGLSRCSHFRMSHAEACIHCPKQPLWLNRTLQVVLYNNHIFSLQNYDKRTNRNDIALIKLGQPVTLNSKLMPACLPDKDYDPAKSRGCKVTGWGATDGFLSRKIDR